MGASLTTKSVGVDGDAALTRYVQDVVRLNAEFDKAVAKGADVVKATDEYNEGMKELGQTLDDTRRK